MVTREPPGFSVAGTIEAGDSALPLARTRGGHVFGRDPRPDLGTSDFVESLAVLDLEDDRWATD